MSDTKNKSSNFLATFFDWNREVIESAETPFSKLAIFLLPVLAPLVPAFMTSLHMYKLLNELFTFQYSKEIAAGMAITTGLVLELLGYVGAITFIRSLFQYIKDKTSEYLLPVILNGLAYLFYVAAMWMINVQLGKYFGTPPIINGIFGILSFITVPTGLLAANHLSQRADDEKASKLREEDREYKLRRLEIKNGGSSNDKAAKQSKVKNASHFKAKMIDELNDAYDRDGTVLSPIYLAKKFNLDYDRSKGFISGLRIQWARSRGIQLKKK